MERARVAIAGIGLVAAVLAPACASSRTDIAEQLRRLQQSGEEDRAPAESAPAAAPARPRVETKESRLARLEADSRLAAERLREAEAGGDAVELASANEALARARRELAAEEETQRKLAELRARTPQRIIRFDDPPGSAPASRPIALPAARPASGPASRPAEAAASGPASRPLAEDEAELARLSERVRWLADLRDSAGDHAGGARLRQAVATLTARFATKDRAEALAALRKVEKEADR